MTALLIAHRREITDPEALADYADGIDTTLAKHGGKVIARADRFEVLEGSWHSGEADDDSEPQRVTVIAFPDMLALKSWYDSEEYGHLKAIRQRSAKVDMVAVEVE